MTQAVKHSPTPWSIEHYSSNTEKLVDADGEFVHFVHKSRMEWTDDDPTGAANVDFIVRCVNAHDELVAALKQIVIDATNGYANECLDIARAALAKVQA